MPDPGPIDTVNALYTRWLGHRYDEIGELVSDDVVIAPPGSEQRVAGRERFVESFRDYDRDVETIVFEPRTPVVDRFDGVAVAVVAFHVEYRTDVAVHKEDGEDLYVLRADDDGWRIVWRGMRTLRSDPA